MKNLVTILSGCGEGVEIIASRCGQGVMIIGKALKEKLYSDYPLFYNPKLKIISSSCREMFNYCVSLAGKDNEKLREYNSATRSIDIFPKLQGKFLEKIMGYKNTNLKE